MDHDPVLSRTYDIMNGAIQDGGYWSAMIAPRFEYKLSITDESEVSFDALSEAELAIVDRVYSEFGHVPRFSLCRVTHSFGEWEDPHGSSIPMSYESVLRGVGYSQEEAAASLEYIKEQQALSDFLETA